MDRQSLHRVLADPSRYGVYEELAGSETPLTIGELAERLDLHPNTVRLHLEKLREAGLVEWASDRHGTVGRPNHVWSTTYSSPSLGLEPSGGRMLAHLLADLAATDPAAPERAAEVGRQRARDLPTGCVPNAGPGCVPNALPGRRGHRAASCLEALTGELAALGFDPVLETGEADAEGVSGAITFRRCPFRELAVLYPDLVCRLHRGLTEGMLSELADGHPCRVEDFATLVDADPCRTVVSVSD